MGEKMSETNDIIIQQETLFNIKSLILELKDKLIELGEEDTLKYLDSDPNYEGLLELDVPRKKPVSLRDISLRQGISLLYLEQIFLKLKKNNLVKSIRGTNGGYILNKDSREIKFSSKAGGSGIDDLSLGKIQ